MSEPNDPFLVTTTLGITAVLQSLKLQKSLVHMRLDNDNRAIITAVLDVNSHERWLIVDATDDAQFNQRLTGSPKVFFEAQIDRVKVQFSCAGATAILFEGREAFRLTYPEHLRRIQRRNHFRIDIPVTMPLLAQIPVIGGRTLKLPVKDISAGGVAVIDHNQELDVTVGAWLKQCTFELDDVGTVVTNLKVRRISEHQSEPGTTPVRVVACEFDHPSAAEAIMVQNYIGRLERMLIARRRGFD